MVTVNSRTGQLDNSRTSQLADWSTRGLDNLYWTSHGLES